MSASRKRLLWFVAIYASSVAAFISMTWVIRSLLHLLT